MGLDVSLYKCNNWEEYSKIQRTHDLLSEEEYASFSAQHPGSYSDWTQEVKDLYSEMYKRMDKAKDKELSDADAEAECIELPSELYPDEHFKIGYFRSSYNDGGINNVARSLGLPGLYDIFGESSNSTEEDYYWVIDWERAKEIAEDAVKQWEIFVNSDAAKYYVTEARYFQPREGVTPIKGKAGAMEAFLAQQKKGIQYDFRSGTGSFFKKPVRVVALIQGEAEFVFGGVQNVSSFLIIENEDRMYDYYLKSMEIVLETIEYVLRKKDPSKYRLAWSS